MNEVYTSQAVILSPDWKETILEKNAKFDWKVTFLWWKLEKGEIYIEWLIRELEEKSWIKFTPEDCKLIIKADRAEEDNVTFIANIYLIKLKTNEQVEDILKHRNLNFKTSNNIWSINELYFAFDAVKRNLEKILEHYNNLQLNK